MVTVSHPHPLFDNFSCFVELNGCILTEDKTKQLMGTKQQYTVSYRLSMKGTFCSDLVVVQSGKVDFIVD